MARKFNIQKPSSHAKVGMSWDRKSWATASLRLWYMYEEAHYPKRSTVQMQYTPLQLSPKYSQASEASGTL